MRWAYDNSPFSLSPLQLPRGAPQHPHTLPKNKKGTNAKKKKSSQLHNKNKTEEERIINESLKQVWKTIAPKDQTDEMKRRNP